MGQLHDAKVFSQAAPFWQQRYPRLKIWKCDVLRPFVEDGTWQEWCNAQLWFCNVYEQGVSRLCSPFLQTPKYEMGNWWLEKKVSRCSF